MPPRKLSPNERFYWGDWGAAKRALQIRFGWPQKDVENFRHTLHFRALGHDKSSKSLTKKETDKVVAVFRAIANPNDRAGQVELLNQGKIRAVEKIRALCGENDISEEYLSGMSQKICKKPTSDCSERELVKVIIALTKHLKRQQKLTEAEPNTPF